ncbi:hypothetical protein KPH14_007015 [Odynerus spinipes]|uniref:Uncharacterized protein n=1 Tax=Odynerus spinipes TaxID=1348599 RepID=A0AAD9VRX1_9HYME|nr:hypothetical protein KPH14_007015 [Odynerus spinipes]
MFGFRGTSNRNAPAYNFPKTKLKNVTCVHCKHQFIIRELLHIRGHQVPLLLGCGHSICYGCAKLNPDKPCPLCQVPVQADERSSELYPLHIYALGLAVIANNRPIHGEDPDISFYQTMPSKLRHVQTQGVCYECEIEATLRCPQCNALYCHACYSKIHGRALQKHTKVPLTETVKNVPLAVGTTCSDNCNESLGYFCKDCRICSCSHCMLRLHSKHDHITLPERNAEFIHSFHKTYDKVAEALQRVQQTQKVGNFFIM